jgi:hypothetical protein
MHMLAHLERSGMHILFANTGIQIVCVPLPAQKRYTSVQIGHGWQSCRRLEKRPDSRSGDEEVPRDFAYVQWQIIQSNVSKLFLAIDTTLGDPARGYFSDAGSMAGDFLVSFDRLLDVQGEPLQGIPSVEIYIRASTAAAGEAKPVHLVVDFGNSRTGALLLEVIGEISQTPKMMPFELLNRYHLDAWNSAGEPLSRPGARWFSSRTRWCNSPYLPPPEITRKEFHRETKQGFLRSKETMHEYETSVRPELFEDLSLCRMGREADDVTQVMHAKGDFRTGVSSPKRYLWADDDSWLEGAFWYMADPYDNCETGTLAAKLQGRLLRYLHEDDRDFLLEDEEPKPEAFAAESPTKPRHAPRTMMVTALYELLCQAYMYVNSLGYRGRTGDASRAREIRTLTMTYPSGMFEPERRRFAQQAEKAIRIFHRTLGKQQKAVPKLTFSIDEASAVHLTFIWSELQMLGQDPRLWFSLLGRQPELIEVGAETGPGARRGAPRRRIEPGPHPAAAPIATQRQELRIACIDIGGGSTDLMIARYRFLPGIDDSVDGEILHRDGISIAGDHLVKRLLEKIIVPAFAAVIGFEDEDVLLLFGPEVPGNRGFASQRIDWMNRLFLPLAEAYLRRAVEGLGDAITHTDPEIVDPTVLESLKQVCLKLRGPGYYNLSQPLRLVYDAARFESVVHEVFDDLLFDFCSRIVEHGADVILLAGQPTKLACLQELVRRYIPLPESRLIAMYNHYAGNWYPYQDAAGDSPGVIVDPKSAVVVGAAIEFLARHGLLPQFKFSMQNRAAENTYYWGVMTESTGQIREERVLFAPAEVDVTGDAAEFTTIAQRMVIGRKMTHDESAQANPIYLLKMDVGNRIGEIKVQVRLRRNRATETSEEHLEIESVSGVVAGEPAILGENVRFNWRTLGDERFFLDTGGLDNIELSR